MSAGWEMVWCPKPAPHVATAIREVPEELARHNLQESSFMKYSILALSLAAVALPIAAQASAAPRARISMAAARATALALVHGRVISAEYENEGPGWRYSFDIRQANRNVQEIGIDAMTGRVVENKSEGRHDKD